MTTSVQVHLLTALAVGLSLAGASEAAHAQVIQPRIANGVPTTDQPTTGALLRGSSGFQTCSGTLIGCHTFLTASHCVCDENGPTCNPTESEYQVYLQHEGLFSVDLITPHPSYVDFPNPANDIAVVTLGSSVDGITPTPLASTPPAFGSSGTIAGFGNTNGANTGSGIKREGAIVTADCGQIGASNSQFLCWEFDPPFGPPGTDSNTCPGDSGGPLFTAEGSETVVAGVASFGTPGPSGCSGADVAGDTNVATFASWVASVSGSDIAQASCGTLPQVGDPDVQVDGFDGSLSGPGDEGVHSFTVPPDTLELRVTLNGQGDGPENFGLWVRFGAPPSAGMNSCEAETSSQFEACALAAPNAGTWYATARSTAGSGAYQITATSFGGSAECGDGNLDAGEQCDDGNNSPGDGCDELCQSESPPACGDGNLDAGEQCDDGNNSPGDGCDEFCQSESPPACGDGVRQRGESCDDGNISPGDGCDEFCQSEPVCGNGTTEGSETCDDGNTQGGDGCSATCQSEPALCGDAVVQVPEECDDANTVPGDGCDGLCQLETLCGDGVVESPEQCDDTNTVSGDGCDGLCQLETLCGDGVVESPEQCDDTNTVSGDGCDGLCQLEPEPLCGDGVVESPEQCDDANTVTGDGCDASCREESAPGGCPAEPQNDCQLAPERGSKLKLVQGRNPAKNRLHWKWKSAVAEGTDLGDPRIDTGYLLCLYDAVDGVPALVLEAEAPAGPLWSAGSRGLRFKGPDLAGQLSRLRLKSRSRLKLTAKGRSVPALPLSQDDAVVLQVRNDLGECWGARYTAPARKNDSLRFVDR